MAVVQVTIKSQLLSLYDDMASTEYTREQFADSMATIIANAILSADVTITTPTTGTILTPEIGTGSLT